MSDLTVKLDKIVGKGEKAEYPKEDRPDLAAYIDHTFLKPEGCLEAIRTLCSEAAEYSFASVCVQPRYVEYCAGQLLNKSAKVCTVIGFPLGANISKVKAEETRVAISDGADEVDMVIPIGGMKDHLYLQVFKDIRAVVEAANGKLTKVIIETSYLDQEEKIAACILAQRAGAHYVKTSTGFSSGGATVEDIALMRKTVGPDMGVKASGGIRDFETAKAMIDAGATRLGVSAGIAIIKGGKGTESY